MANDVSDQDAHRLLTWLVAATRRGDVSWEEVFHGQYGIATEAGTVLLANSNAEGEESGRGAQLTLTLMTRNSAICRQIGAPATRSTPTTPEELLAAGEPQGLLDLVDELYVVIRAGVRPAVDAFDVDTFIASL